jgi:capsular exopolysaccharide synthesis family protein
MNAVASPSRLPVVVQPPVTKISPSAELVVLSDPTCESAEAIRALRTRLQSDHVKSGRRGLAVCAPNVGVGCSVVAANLAIAMSQAGVNTLLLDANLRAPRVQEMFGIEGAGGGLAACLGGSMSLDDALHHQALPNLDVLVAGRTTQPQEVLASPRFGEILHACFRDYDMTIIDTSPANSSADSLLVANAVGFAIIVARKNRTMVADMRTLAQQLRGERAQVLGTVLTSF